MSDGINKYLKTLAGPVADAVSSLKSLEALETVFFSVDEKASSIIKTFGVGRENILSIKQNMTEAYSQVAKMGGTFENIGDIQENIAKTLNRNVILNGDSYKEFYAMMEVTNQTIGTITTAFKNAGFSIYDASKQMEGVVRIAQDLGINVEDVSSKVLSNMDQLNRFTFQGGVEGLAKMAAQASSLRVNMSSTLDFAAKVFNPEGAIEQAAALQRLGVTQAQLLDPLRLMNLAQNDPTELQNQIVEMTRSFVKMGEAGNFEIMPGMKNRLFEISKVMGISYTELTKMALGSAELEDKMKKIKFPDAEQFASKETRQLIANLAEKGKDGEYRIKFTDAEGKTQEKSITELSPEDIDRIKTPPKKMEELAVDQLSVLKSIESSIKAMSAGTAFAFAGTQTGEQILLAEKEMYTRISDTFTKTFDVKTIRDGLDKGLQGMFDAIIQKDFAKGFTDAGNAMADLLQGVYGKFKEEGGKNFDEFTKSENKLIKVFTTLGDQAQKLATDGFDKLGEKLQKIVGGGNTLPGVSDNTLPGVSDNTLPGVSGNNLPGVPSTTTPELSGNTTPEQGKTNNLGVNTENNQNRNQNINDKLLDRNKPNTETNSFFEKYKVNFFDPLEFGIESLKNKRMFEEKEQREASIGKLEANQTLNFTIELKTDGIGRNDENKLKDDLVNVIKDPKVNQAIKLELEKISSNTISEIKKILAANKIKYQ